jgi:hypothetical protein
MMAKKDTFRVVTRGHDGNLQIRDFPDDVLAAAGAARKARHDSSPPADPTSEPWPPMRTVSDA